MTAATKRVLSQDVASPGLLDIQANVALGPLTTLQVGGPARWLLRAASADQVRAGLAWARNEGLAVWILGGGSNVVVADAGLPGLVLQPGGHSWQARPVARSGAVQVRVEAGAVWDDLVAWSVAEGLGGIECLSGIPGHCGAAPIQNIGAYGQEVAEVIESVEALDVASGQVLTWTREDCAFAYRDSAFKRAAGSQVVLAMTVRLQANAQPAVRYAQVAEALLGRTLEPGAAGLQALREVVLALRRSKAMVIDASEPDSRSCGSFFVNPIVTVEQAAAVATRMLATLQAGTSMPQWPARDGVKLSAAWLIERSGMPRGYGDGPVGLSRKHTLALVNRGGATAAQVLAFAGLVQDRVRQATGVQLEREPVLLGF